MYRGFTGSGAGASGSGSRSAGPSEGTIDPKTFSSLNFEIAWLPHPQAVQHSGVQAGARAYPDALSRYEGNFSNCINADSAMQAARVPVLKDPQSQQNLETFKNSMRQLRKAYEATEQSFFAAFAGGIPSDLLAAQKSANAWNKNLLDRGFEKELQTAIDYFPHYNELMTKKQPDLADNYQQRQGRIRAWTGGVDYGAPVEPSYGHSSRRDGAKYSPYGTPPEGNSLSPFGSTPWAGAFPQGTGGPVVYGYGQRPMPPAGWATSPVGSTQAPPPPSYMMPAFPAGSSMYPAPPPYLPPAPSAAPGMYAPPPTHMTPAPLAGPNIYPTGAPHMASGSVEPHQSTRPQKRRNPDGSLASDRGSGSSSDAPPHKISRGSKNPGRGR